MKHSVMVNGKCFEVEVEQEPYTGKTLNRYPPAVPRAPIGAPQGEPAFNSGPPDRDRDDAGNPS